MSRQSTLVLMHPSHDFIVSSSPSPSSMFPRSFKLQISSLKLRLENIIDFIYSNSVHQIELRVLPSTGVAPGPPLPHHLALHPYAQATLPLGYASMIGYPSLPQSYAYIPPTAFQQPYMNSGLFHQAAAAVPNTSVKYPLPQYKSNVALSSLPQPASLLSSYVGGFGTANSMPGNFALNQSTASATTTPGFDGTVPSQYKDGNHFISLQQSENPAMWMHGAGSRAMPPLAANPLYGYQGQGHQGGLRQGQLPSQFGAALGQSQPGLGPEHRNPSDSNLSAAAAQANQMWPNSY